MHAEIATFNRFMLEKFYETYEGSNNKLGTEKLYAKFQYVQTAVAIQYDIFQALSS